MAEQDRGSDDPRLAAAARHALHDEELVAAYAANDLDDLADLERARSFVERCAMCRDLHADLVTIRGAIQASGSAAQRATTLAAPRDFRLSAEDAARLRPETPLARLGARLGWRARLGLGVATFGRPLGAGLATLGIAGLLIGSLTLTGGRLALTAGSGAAPSAEPAIDQTLPAPAASAMYGEFSPRSTGKEAVTPPITAAGGEDEGRGSLLILGGSAVLLVIGIALVLVARRRIDPTSTPRGN